MTSRESKQGRVNTKLQFLSDDNIKVLVKMTGVQPKILFPIMQGYLRDDVLNKAQDCLAVLNYMFAQNLSIQDYDILGQSLCNKPDRADIDY